MKALFTRFLSISLVCIGSTALERPSDDGSKTARDAILFRNGDLLFGRLNSIDRENGIQWARSDALNAFQFDPGNVSQVDFAEASRTDIPSSTNMCSVHLHNGDQLQGDLASYDGEKVTLDTWFGGRLVLPKSAVALIVPLGLPKPVLFAGPKGLEGWTMGKVTAGALVESGEWIYQNEAFYAMKSASIARDLKLPDSMSLQFDIEWRGFFHVAVALYTAYLHPINLANKETEPQFGGFYSLQLNPFSANLLPVKQNEPLRYLGQASLQQLAQTNAANVDIRVNKSKKLVALLVNGNLVKQWTDEDFAGTGSAVRFVHQGQGAVKLTNIRVSEWDGSFEEPAIVTPNKTQDMARLKNGDRVIGNVKALRDGKLSIEAAGTILDVPVTRVKQVELASAQPSGTKAGEQAVRAYFTSGNGSLTFSLEKWTDAEMSATSENFGSAKFKPEAFSRIVFDVKGDEAARVNAP
jgi:hypothetical protein